MNDYLELIKEIPEEPVQEVVMNNGSIIKCKRIPLSTIDDMDTFLHGIKNSINFSEKALNYIASCGKTKLYSPVGNPSDYLRKKDGTMLANIKGEKRGIGKALGYREIKLTAEGIEKAAKVAKALPYISIAVTCIETGTQIIAHQQEIRAEQLKVIADYKEKLENHIDDMWTSVNDYTHLIKDEASRTAHMTIILTAYNEAKRTFNKLLKEAQNGKKIEESLVYTLKTALDLFSFSSLLKIMYSKTECIEYIKEAVLNIEKQTSDFHEVCNNFINQCEKLNNKANNLLNNVQIVDKKDKKSIVKRASIDAATIGLAELVSIGSKKAQKHIDKISGESIDKVKSLINSSNPYLGCIENVYRLITENKQILMDDKNLYYQVD